MRETKADGRTVRNTAGTLMRALQLGAVALGIGLVMTTGAARAQDDEDDKTFEEKIIDGIMRGIGATNMDNAGIEYRERSPLVVPPKLDLPPPDAAAKAAEVKAPNWPKDPDEARRKAMAKLRKKENKDPIEAARVLKPSELDARLPAGSNTGRGPQDQPGGYPGNNPALSPSQLGFDSGFFGMFKGNKTETAEFKGEPPRDALTQPPAGYQTPSPAYAYGTGPRESLNKEYNPAAGKYGD
jgi:hypothetical protein